MPSLWIPGLCKTVVYSSPLGEGKIQTEPLPKIRRGLPSDSGGQSASDQQSAQNKADPVAEQGAARLSIE